MKRSEINLIIRNSISFLKELKFLLPPFAYWSPRQWQETGPAARDISRQQLGWDITDFGGGDFAAMGLVLFTIRNGTVAELANPLGKTYAEKVLIVQERQITPTHFHYQKMEDIINRGGGNLIIRLWNSTTDDKLADTAVTVSIDGTHVTIPAGGTITLHPGESVCLTQRLYHCFWGQEGHGPILVGEVSRVNDDHIDNRFLEPIGRFPEIIEDTEPLHLLYNDYQRYYTHGTR
ncbi:MAG: D-lyxose/D-mannose family sugar isomerase [Phycisphaerae bacterium]